MEANYVLVIDIGKTHIKLHLLNQQLASIQQFSKPNRVLPGPPYPHFDICAIWDWLLECIRSLPQRQEVSALSITTHGATAALINRQLPTKGLVLPVLDYEFADVATISNHYEQYRPAFSQTFSPELPLGLNLGRQLYWLQAHFPDQFAQTSDILMYPQYWSWRFSGVASTEVTSLGCHTDLWEPCTKSYSSLVKNMGWEKLFPPLVPAWQCVGTIKHELAKATGLSLDCMVFAGVHDSNASYLRYLPHIGSKPFAVVSTGTWTIAMSNNTQLDLLKAERDMLANVDVNGNPVACSRFMGGREFEIICEKLGTNISDTITTNDLQQVIDEQVMALPNFSEGSGPFPNAKPGFVGDISKVCAGAIATLYCALVIDFQLELLQVSGDIFIEGSFLKNTLLCSVLAQLRGSQKVFLSSDTTGTVAGCALLTRRGNHLQPDLSYETCTPVQLEGLETYKNRWRQSIT